MAGIIQEGLQCRSVKGDPKPFASQKGKISSPWELGHMVNFEFSWIQEPVPLSQDMASGLR